MCFPVLTGLSSALSCEKFSPPSLWGLSPLAFPLGQTFPSQHPWLVIRDGNRIYMYCNFEFSPSMGSIT